VRIIDIIHNTDHHLNDYSQCCLITDLSIHLRPSIFISEKGSIPGDVEGKVDLGSSPSAIHSSPNITRNSCTEPKYVSFINIPPGNSHTATISMLSSLKPSLLPHPSTAKPQALSNALYKPLAVDLKYSVWHRFGSFNPTYLDCRESKRTSISIHGYHG